MAFGSPPQCRPIPCLLRPPKSSVPLTTLCSAASISLVGSLLPMARLQKGLSALVATGGGVYLLIVKQNQPTQQPDIATVYSDGRCLLPPACESNSQAGIRAARRRSFRTSLPHSRRAGCPHDFSPYGQPSILGSTQSVRFSLKSPILASYTSTSALYCFSASWNSSSVMPALPPNSGSGCVCRYST
jgi:hypothetical protein